MVKFWSNHRKKIILSLLGFVILIVVLSLFSSYVRSLGLGEAIRTILRENKAIAWPLYVFFTMLAVLSPLPDSIVTTAGGYVFGPKISFFLSLLGIVIATSINFYIGRLLGKPFIYEYFPHARKFIEKYGDYLNFQSVLLFKIAPNLSIDVLALASGVSPIPYAHFAVASAIGVLPSLLTGILVGDGIQNDDLLVTVPIIIGIYSLAALLVYILRKTETHRKRKIVHTHKTIN